MLDKPIMIACAGRSGSTLFYRILARHRDLAWLSTYNQALPKHVWLSAFSRLYGMRAFDRLRNDYWFPKPFSPYKFWQRYLPDIARHDRPLFAADVPDAAIGPLQRTLARVVRYQGKRRFLMKVTGWARLAYFDRILPDARFIVLRRQPIAVITSWVKAGWLNVTGEVGTPAWEWGEVPAAYRRIYDDLGGGPLLAAAMKTQLDVDDLQRNAALFPGRVLEIHYEDFVTEPHRVIRETFDFCELEAYPGFDRVLATVRIQDMKEKWRQILAPEDGERVLEFFRRTQLHANVNGIPAAQQRLAG